MSQTLLSILAFVPLVLAGVLLIGFRWPAKYAMPVVFLLTAIIGLTAWDMSFNRVLASSLQGLILTAAILWIIFGAILLLNTLKTFRWHRRYPPWLLHHYPRTAGCRH